MVLLSGFHVLDHSFVALNVSVTNLEDREEGGLYLVDVNFKRKNYFLDCELQQNYKHMYDEIIQGFNFHYTVFRLVSKL